jgi:sugar lactone lactonase YvrE
MSAPPELPPIFSATPMQMSPARIIVEFPAQTFLESIVVGADNTLFVSSHLDGKIWRIGQDGLPVLHAAIAGKATGLAAVPTGGLLLSAWDEQNVATVFQISPQGEIEVMVTIPDAIFLNGMTHLDGDRYLIADSYRGAIWALDVGKKTAQIWLEHPHLARSTPDKEFPAANGLKIFEDALYVSNTEKMQVVKIPIQPDLSPGEPEGWGPTVNLDDFAFDMAGNLYGTTHVYNSVVKISPDGTMLTIAEAEQGMTGSTALAFGRGDGDLTAVYVVTNGGLSFPPPTGLESAKIVRLEVGREGLPL